MSAHKAQSINKGAFLQEDGTSRNVVRAVTLAWQSSRKEALRMGAIGLGRGETSEEVRGVWGSSRQWGHRERPQT